MTFIPFTSYGYNRSGVGMFDLGYERGLGLGGKMPRRGQPNLNLGDYAYTNALPDSAVVAPSDMIAVGDAFIRAVGYADGEQSLHADIGFGFMGKALLVRHKENVTFKNQRGRLNYAFADGHVEAENINRWIGPNNLADEKMRRWNNDNEPHRDLWFKDVPDSMWNSPK